MGVLFPCRITSRLDLDGVVPESVAAEDVVPTAAVFGLFGDARFLEEAAALRSVRPLSDLGAADMVEFLFRLGLERMGRVRKVFSSENPGELAWEAHIVLRRGLEALEPWPDEFHRTLDDMRGRWGTGPRISMMMCAGAVERWLGNLPDDDGQHIRAAVESYRAQDAARRDCEA
jgi:hypothetical protein